MDAYEVADRLAAALDENHQSSALAGLNWWASAGVLTVETDSGQRFRLKAVAEL